MTYIKKAGKSFVLLNFIHIFIKKLQKSQEIQSKDEKNTKLINY
jgi:hypothetical protein